MELLPITADKVLPRPFVSRRARARQRQFFQPQSSAKAGNLLRRDAGRVSSRNKRRAGRHVLAQYFVENRRKAFGGHAIRCRSAALKQGCGGSRTVVGSVRFWHALPKRDQNDASNYLDARKRKSYVL